MRISGQSQISVAESRQLRQVTATKRGDKRGTDVNIIGNTSEFDNAFNDPRFSIALNAGQSDFYFYAPVPANTKRNVLGGVFTSTVYWKVELIVDGVSIYTMIGEPFETVALDFKGFKLPANEVLTIKFTNVSANPSLASIYSTLEFSDEAV